MYANREKHFALRGGELFSSRPKCTFVMAEFALECTHNVWQHLSLNSETPKFVPRSISAAEAEIATVEPVSTTESFISLSQGHAAVHVVPIDHKVGRLI